MKYIFLLISIFTVISCDPGYSYIINNNSEKDIYVFTEPNYKKYFYESKLDSIFYDSIVIKAKKNFTIYSAIGWGGSEESFPYKKIKIKKDIDSIILNNKPEINSKFNLNRKKKLFSTLYTIEVK
ncbi:hypothetical protein PQ459_15005 [Chryseobacterium sp. KACC 21268]|nr:hypothetical protein PQ459_15005 [Chryseobacterium sp. KACC 21268]